MKPVDRNSPQLPPETRWQSAIRKLRRRPQKERVPVRCSDCGFLAIRRQNEAQTLYAGEQFRVTGQSTAPESIGLESPVCYSRAVDLGKEARDFRSQFEVAQPSLLDFQSAVLHTVRDERFCDQFTPLSLDLSAREHQEMLDRQWKYEQERKERRWAIWFRVIGAIIFITAGAGTAILAALIERGTLFGTGGN